MAFKKGGRPSRKGLLHSYVYFASCFYSIDSNSKCIMKKMCLALLAPLMFFSYTSMAQGDLLITQKRVVFEGNKQIEELDLVNTGRDTATYSISFLHFNMKEDGSYQPINQPDPGQMFADPYLRIFPRQVTLAPGEPQIIMLQCRRSADMVAGEYRSHLYFRSEKNYKPLGTKIIDTNQLAVQLIPIYGISIPVMIRSGQVSVTATLSDLKLEVKNDTLAYLRLSVNRTGNISVYGDITVDYVNARGNVFPVGSIMNVGVLSNISKRNVTVRLHTTAGLDLKNGTLKVSYLNNDNPKKPLVYDAQQLTH